MQKPPRAPKLLELEVPSDVLPRLKIYEATNK